MINQCVNGNHWVQIERTGMSYKTKCRLSISSIEFDAVWTTAEPWPTQSFLCVQSFAGLLRFMLKRFFNVTCPTKSSRPALLSLTSSTWTKLLGSSVLFVKCGRLCLCWHIFGMPFLSLESHSQSKLNLRRWVFRESRYSSSPDVFTVRVNILSLLDSGLTFFIKKRRACLLLQLWGVLGLGLKFKHA